MRLAVLEFAVYEAVIVTCVETGTVEVVMVNGAVAVPAAIVAVGGTIATPGFELVSATTAPPYFFMALRIT
jgi:hypothetical protein